MADWSVPGSYMVTTVWQGMFCLMSVCSMVSASKSDASMSVRASLISCVLCARYHGALHGSGPRHDIDHALDSLVDDSVMYDWDLQYTPIVAFGQNWRKDS
jgi:hypothetical protein